MFEDNPTDSDETSDNQSHDIEPETAGYADFPGGLQHLIDYLREEGYIVIYGSSRTDPTRPAFIAKQSETFILIEDWAQTWALNCCDADRPDYRDTWAYPRRVRSEVWEWLQDYGD